MRYRCTSCDKEFDVPEGDRPRCPSCLRIHDVEAVERRKPASSRYRGLIVVAVVVAAAVGGYAYWYRSQESGETAADGGASSVEAGPMDDAALRAELGRRGLKAAEIVLPFATTKEVETFASKAARGAASPREKVVAVQDAIRELASGAHESYVASAPRAAGPKSPTETLAALRSDEPYEPYPFELAALMVAALRSLGVEAALAEVFRYQGEARPADASGTIGHYAVAIPEGESYERPAVYDPSTGRRGDNARGDVEVLTDVEAAGSLLVLRALHEVAFGEEASEGERLATLAVRLRPESATALAARGTVRLLAGGGELSARAALEEYERALRARSDPQRKVLVARVLLAAQQVPRAEELVRSALEDAPEFAAAHGLMGMIHAASRRIEEAQASITRAEELEPRDPHLGLLWVQLHIAQRDLGAAAEAALAVVDRVPDDPQPRLLLAQVLWEDAQYGAAEAQLRELLRRDPDNDRLRDLLREAFDFDPSAEDLDVDGGEEVAAAGDGGVESGGDGGALGLAPQLQMGKGLGKVRLGGPQGFQLSGPGGLM